MPGTVQESYLNYNQTPNHASDFYTTPENYELVQQVLAEQPQPLPADQEQQVQKFAKELEKPTYPADLLNLGERISYLRRDAEVYNN